MRIKKIGPKIIESKPFSYFDIFCPLIGTSWFSVCLLTFVWQFPLSIQQLPLMLKLPCIWHYLDVIALKELSSRGEGSQDHRRQRGKTLLLWHVKSWAQEVGILRTLFGTVLGLWLHIVALKVWFPGCVGWGWLASAQETRRLCGPKAWLASSHF